MAKIDIAGRLHSVATGNIVTGADEVLDDRLGQKQNIVNANVQASLAQLSDEDTAINQRLALVERMKDKSVGLFSTVESLNAKEPSPKVGEWALVGTSSPFAVYECATAGTWTATGGTYDAGEIDLADYATVESVEAIEDMLDGGVEETQATNFGWADNMIVKPATGNTPSGDTYTSYSATDLIEIIPARATSVRLMHIHYPTSSGLTSMGLAFYDANEVYISGQDFIVDPSVSGVTMKEAIFAIPSGAKYLRETCRKSDKSSWYCYFRVQNEGLMDRVSALEGEMDDVAEVANGAEANAQDALIRIEALEAIGIEPSHIVYEKADDPQGNGSSNTARYGVAFYTPIFNAEKKFNEVIVKGVYASSAVNVQWRVYAYDGATASGGTDDQPAKGYIGNHHTLLASGTVDIGTTAADITIKCGAATCPSGSQVLIYLVDATSTTKINVAKCSGTIPADTHGTYYTDSGWDSQWTPGLASNGYTVHAPILRYQSAFATPADVEEMIEEALEDFDIEQDIDILLPDTIYVLVGSEINLYNDNISLSVDKGLMSPLNYIVEWSPSASNITMRFPRGIRIRPSEAGSFTMDIRLRDKFDHLLAEKTITIVAVAKDALTAEKNILMVGSSSCPDTAKEVYNIFNNPERYTGTKPTMRGTLVTGGAHHEGRGGYKWSNYLGSTNNPFYNPETGEIDITNYRTVTLGMTAHFDLVLFQLGLNDYIQHIGSTPKTVAEYYNTMASDVSNMNTLINDFLEDSPDCKIVLALPYICENTGAMGATKTANYNNWEFNKASYAMRLRYMEFAAAHPEYILAAGHQVADRYWGFAFKQINISDRYSAYVHGGRESIPSDAIHTGVVGHQQYADGFAACIIGTLGTVESGGNVGYSPDVNYS